MIWNTVIWPMLANTPWWVYLIFAYLIVKGIKASRPRLLPIKRLVILPIVLLGFSIYGLVEVVAFNPINGGIWFVCLLIGAVLGHVQIRQQKLVFDKKSHLVQTPGSWSMLILILVIFLSKYYFAYSLAIHPAEVQHLIFRVSLLGISGLCNGLLLGRLGCFFYKMWQAEHVPLK